ncbi:MAG TPA: shikimate kinase [Elusimicrobiales bacterium]|nr:shikimate kinase [Elusimicrobiales bacterium]
MANKNPKNAKKHQRIIIYGFMASGKTTVGRMVAKKLSLSFYDTDIEFEKKYGSIKKFVEEKGIRRFRKLEKKILSSVLKKKNCVISTGGGIVPSGKEGNLEFFIMVPWKRLFKRLKKGESKRPLLKDLYKNKDKVKKLYEKRLKKYLKAENVLKDRTIKELSDKISKIWKSR